MDQLVKSPDFTWAMSKVFVWSCCEPFVGIVCACLPTYAPLVRRWWTSSQSRRGNTYPNTPQYASDKPSRHGNWSNNLHGGDTTLRGDDEVELTMDVTCKGPRGESIPRPKGSPESDHSVGYRNEIMVRKDFYWSSSV